MHRKRLTWWMWGLMGSIAACSDSSGDSAATRDGAVDGAGPVQSEADGGQVDSPPDSSTSSGSDGSTQADSAAEATSPDTGIDASATCHNGVKDGTETDLDCGGPCTPCQQAKHCAARSDCVTNWCNAGTCQVPVPGGCGYQVTADGNLTDNEWAAPWEHVDRVTLQRLESDVSPSFDFKMRWDPDNLYLATKNHDSTVTSSDTYVWQDTSVWLYIDIANSHSSYNRKKINFGWALGFQSQTPIERYGRNDITPAQQYIGGGEWVTEWAIPWSLLTVTPKEGVVLGGDVGYLWVHGRNATGDVWWNGIGIDNRDAPLDFGEMKLTADCQVQLLHYTNGSGTYGYDAGASNGDAGGTQVDAGAPVDAGRGDATPSDAQSAEGGDR